jgi:hypothetical protein
MNDQERQGETTPAPTPAAVAPGIFATRPVAERTPIPVTAGVVAVVAVLVVIGAVLVSSRHTAMPVNAAQPLDPYAGQLTLSNLALSESTSLSGGKSTYIDGSIKNAGTKTVTGATVQALFANDEGMAPQVQTTPLMLVRTHEPYIDTEPVSTAPLKPGDEREFRLTFEGIGTNWNQQIPAIHFTQVETR